MAKVVSTEITGKKEKYWVSYIKQRISRNKNFIAFVSGPTGSGKSYSSLRICQEVDPDFSIDRVVFNALEFMNLINSGKLRKGSAICFDEAGVDLDAKSWYSLTNKMMNYVFQTFRHLNLVIIMNSPYMDFVDASTRKLFHAEFRTMGIDLKEKKVILKPLLLQYNSSMRKWYRKRLRVITREGSVPVSTWRVSKPSKDLLKVYEDKKTDFTRELNRNIYADLLRNQPKNKSGLTEIQQDTLDMLKEGLTVPQIAEKRQKDEAVVRHSIRLIKKKGYIIKPIKDGKKVVKYSVKSPG